MPAPIVVQLLLAVATPIAKGVGRGVEKLIARRRVRRVTEPDDPQPAAEPAVPEVVVTVQIGSKGETVRELQARLDALGYPLTVDGDFGPGTARAVKQFQAAQGLSVDGVVGPATWAALSTGGLPDPDPVDTDVDLDALPGRVLSFALSDVGKVESPNGANAGPAISHLVDGYNAYWRIDSTKRFPWCVMAASVWTARALGLGDRGDAIDWKKHPFGHWFGATSQVEDWATAKGLLSTEWSECEPGALYVMAREGSSSDPGTSTRAGHTGIVVAVDLAARVIHTVDGNVSNKVARRTRSFDEVAGWIKWW